MKSSFITYIKIRFFPGNILDYLNHLLFNFIFSFILFFSIPFWNSLIFQNNSVLYTLLIPQTDDNFEEKKDLIFSRLSLNNNILSVSQIDEKIIIDKLKNNIKSESDLINLIPEVHDIKIKKNKKLDLLKENKIISAYLEGAIIFKNNDNKSYSNLITFLTITLFLSLYILFHFILFYNSCKKIMDYLKKSRIFGAQDISMVSSVGVGYFAAFLFGGVLSYLLIYLIEFKYFFSSIILDSKIETIILFFIMKYLLCILNSILTLNSQVRRFM